jgi:hypothetical protein
MAMQLNPKIAEKLRAGEVLTMEEEREAVSGFNHVLGHFASVDINDVRDLFARLQQKEA